MALLAAVNSAGPDFGSIEGGRVRAERAVASFVLAGSFGNRLLLVSCRQCRSFLR